MPDGVYNVVQGEGQTGADLVNHPMCDKLSFTGKLFCTYICTRAKFDMIHEYGIL